MNVEKNGHVLSTPNDKELKKFAKKVRKMADKRGIKVLLMAEKAA